jgi:hypothetical protein
MHRRGQNALEYLLLIGVSLMLVGYAIHANEGVAKSIEVPLIQLAPWVPGQSTVVSNSSLMTIVATITGNDSIKIQVTPHEPMAKLSIQFQSRRDKTFQQSFVDVEPETTVTLEATGVTQDDFPGMIIIMYTQKNPLK